MKVTERDHIIENQSIRVTVYEHLKPPRRFKAKPHGSPVFEFETNSEYDLIQWLKLNSGQEYTVLIHEFGEFKKTVNGEYFTSPETYNDYRIKK